MRSLLPGVRVRLRLPGAAALAVALMLVAAACENEPTRTFVIVAGSENKSLEPIVLDFCRAERWRCEMRYLGSVDIKLALDTPEPSMDAVWPAHSRWIELGDRARRVKHATSIMTSPVAFGVRQSVADELGLKDRKVTTAELVDLVNDGRLRFLMTSATQSNSGFSAYIGMLSALAGSPEVLTDAMLDDPGLRERVGALLKGVERTAGSSGWLADLYLEGTRHGQYRAMVNYEALIIETNRTLEAEGLEPLYAVYPADGTAIADSPLGFVARGLPDEADREAFFLKLKAHLLSREVQADILALGRRTGLGGMVTNADPDVFRADWGIDPARPLPVIRFPGANTIETALNLYQEVLRKPSLLALCLDYSGSMNGVGEASLETAIARLFDPETAKRFLIQPNKKDVFLVYAFADGIKQSWVARGPEEAAALPVEITAVRPGGGTDIYGCAGQALQALHAWPHGEDYVRGIVLMTDGRSQGDPDAFARTFTAIGADVPVFGITFGDAEVDQLTWLADLSRARVFDGRSDLEMAFRHARGYN